MSYRNALPPIEAAKENHCQLCSYGRGIVPPATAARIDNDSPRQIAIAPMPIQGAGECGSSFAPNIMISEAANGISGMR